MAALAKHDAAASLPSLVRDAAARLAAAETSAEVLDARLMATAAYDAAKSAARIAKAKKSHDEVVVAARRAQADALEIEAAAVRRLADEYDAAQDRGEVRTQGNIKPSEREGLPTASDIGLSHKDIHEARQLRDAERDDPGITRRVINAIVDRGDEPTRAAVRREIVPARQPVIADDATWVWGRVRDFERDNYFTKNPSKLLAGMTDAMRSDMKRLVPRVREFFEEMEIACDRA